MADYTAKVNQIRDAGILLKAEGEHTVRVLGARSTVRVSASSPSLQEMGAGAGSASVGKLFSGQIQAPDDGAALHEIAYTADGNIVLIPVGEA